jgi:peptidyl-prolyl cis-trans isomerase C
MVSTRLHLALAASLAAVWLVAAPPAAAFDADKVVARVNGTEITLGHVAIAATQLPPELRAQPAEVLFRGILEQLIRQAAVAELGDGALSRRDRLALDNYRRSLLAASVLERALEPALSEGELRRAYDERYAAAAPETEFNAAHILVASEQEAREIAAQIAGGAGFGDMARRHSTDGAAASGGNLGWFSLGVMVPEFEDAVKLLQPGQVSEPVQTRFGWHLVLLNDRRIASVPPFDLARQELAARIEQTLVTERIAEALRLANIERQIEGIDPSFVLAPPDITD